MEKIFANDMTDKGLIPDKHKQLSYQKKKHDSKIGRKTEQTFFQRGTADGQ